jgi:hypothetical protein
VMLMNFPTALIIMSFDKVHTMRNEKIQRGNIVTDLLFQWVDRHKGKVELKKKKRKNGKLKGSIRRASLHVQQKKFNTVVSESAEIRRLRIRDRMRLKVARKVARKKFCEMILYPESYSFNDEMNPREHFLVSKYFHLWQVITFKKENEDGTKVNLDPFR